MMHPMQPGCSGCIMAATDATRMHVTQPHQMQQCCAWSGRLMMSQVTVAVAAAWHAECAIGPYAALQAARVHATCRMMQLMQLRSPIATWSPRECRNQCGSNAVPVLARRRRRTEVIGSLIRPRVPFRLHPDIDEDIVTIDPAVLLMQVVGIEPDHLRPDRDRPAAGLGPRPVRVLPWHDADLLLGGPDVLMPEARVLRLPGSRCHEGRRRRNGPAAWCRHPGSPASRRQTGPAASSSGPSARSPGRDTAFPC